MTNRVLLVSNDNDFFEFIKSKLELRMSDEVITYTFDEINNQKNVLNSSVIIVNSENSKEKTLELLVSFKGFPVIVSAFNQDDDFKRACYELGMFDFISLLDSTDEILYKIKPAFAFAELIENNDFYKDLLVNEKIIFEEKTIFTDYNKVLDYQLGRIYSKQLQAVFMAIAPSDKNKFLIKSEDFEKILLNNIRKNDVIIKFAPNKYFLLLLNVDLNKANIVWQKISKQLPQKVFAGFAQITNQRKQHLINDVLNKLHLAINNERFEEIIKDREVSEKGIVPTNFKMFKQDFQNNLSKIITPVFYQIEQKYSSILGISISYSFEDGEGVLIIKSRNSKGLVRISSAGFTKVNLDIILQKDEEIVDSKRISFELNEFENGVLEDILEQFILEFKKENNNDFI